MSTSLELLSFRTSILWILENTLIAALLLIFTVH